MPALETPIGDDRLRSVAAAVDTIHRIASECAERGWNGEGAPAVDDATVSRAVELVHALPAWAPFPEFSAEPDGSICLDWIPSRSRMLSVSVGQTDGLPYAWLDGSEHGHGVSRFDGEVISTEVLDRIRETMKDV